MSATDGRSGDGRPAGPPGRETVTLRPPGEVIDIAKRLEGAGYETWCVGGAVRDALLGHPHSDWDLATAAHPEDVMRLFPRRTVPVGIAHGTVGILDRSRTLHEVTTFRRDVRTDGRHAEVAFGVSLDEDLARRDFTINAIAYSPTQHELRDPFHGQVDLGLRIVRAVGRASDRMREDRLRALRALRFAGRFDFSIDPETWEAIVSSAPFLTQLSAERVKEELTKTMVQVARPSRSLALWQQSGALAVLIPTLAALDGVGLATLDCLAAPAERTGPRAAARADARRLARLAALFLGCPYGDTMRSLKALRFSNADTEWIAALVWAWHRVGTDMELALVAGGVIPDSTLRRWVAAVGRPRMPTLLRLGAARWAASRAAGGPAPAAARVHSLYRRAVHSAFRDAVELSDLAVDGSDLLEVGIQPGPMVGVILRRLLVAVVEDQSVNVRDQLLILARKFAADAARPREEPRDR